MSSAQSGLAAIEQAFADARGAAALMPYVMAGFPSLAESLAIGQACVQAGADLIELGVPYSDPLADGPVIQAAGSAALRAGAHLTGVLEVARALSESVPVVLMCYANVVFAPGVDAFAQRLARSGASGLIVPDLPDEEAGPAREACEREGLALVALVAPSTPEERMASIGSHARGFLYAVSVLGTTGERSELPSGAGRLIADAKAHSDVPVALGFGISTPAHARAAAQAGADGVIVGTRLVRAAGESADPAEAVGAVVAELAAGLAGDR